MRWHPSWVIVLILVHVLIYAIVASILTRRATVNVPLCDAHKGHFFKRSLLTWGSFFIFLAIGAGAIIIGLNLDRQLSDKLMPFICTFSCILGVTWLIIIIACHYTAVRCSEITDTEIALTGVAAEFVDAVGEEERDRVARRMARRRERDRWRDEEEDDDPPPRRRRSEPDERFEDD
jgi:hypothetical protein